MNLPTKPGFYMTTGEYQYIYRLSEHGEWSIWGLEKPPVPMTEAVTKALIDNNSLFLVYPASFIIGQLNGTEESPEPVMEDWEAELLGLPSGSPAILPYPRRTRKPRRT